jgi:hypothetical protein
MKKTPKILPTFYKSKGTPIFRDTTALPFANGGIIHFERSEYGSDAREHYDDGGPIYTYSKRPGSFYQRGADGAWMINNSSTGGQYAPIDDPTGQRTALLNKNAVVYNAPAQGAAKPVMNQAVWNKAEKQGMQELAAKQFIANVNKQSSTAGLYMPDGLTLRPQAAQAADWVPQAMMGAPIAAEALGAVASIPLGAGVNLGGVANAAGLVHGTTQVDDRYQDWQDVAAGNMDWKEAALKTGMTGLEMGAGAAELYPNIYRASLPGTSVESGKAFKTLYPQAQMMPSGYKTYGQTQYVSPVSVNKNFTWNFDDLKNIKSSEGLPEYMNPYLYSKEIMQKRSSPELDAYYKMKEVEGVTDKLIKRKIDDRVYYDLNGNIVKTPSDNY